MKQLLEHPIIKGYVPIIRKAIGLGSQLDEVKFMSSFVFYTPTKSTMWKNNIMLKLKTSSSCFIITMVVVVFLILMYILS
jgi:hypothetical protein